ncbi:CFEM domain-containing protein [Sporobolomyces koalae]|uniref:CFEM domain-containing protein n=1 Tax=Sporobolomyces koalae TaxID=500713 RepID=UPI00318267BF
MRSFTVFAAIAALVPTVFAQTNVPTCVVTCIGDAAARTSCQSTDSQCLCSSQTFLEGVSACMQKSCSAEDLAFGIKFGEQYCATAGVSVTVPTNVGGAIQITAAPTATVDTTSASSAISSAASSASESIAASGTAPTTAAPAASPTSAASSLYLSAPFVLAGVAAALML